MYKTYIKSTALFFWSKKTCAKNIKNRRKKQKKYWLCLQRMLLWFQRNQERRDMVGYRKIGMCERHSKKTWHDLFQVAAGLFLYKGLDSLPSAAEKYHEDTKYKNEPQTFVEASGIDISSCWHTSSPTLICVMKQ